MEERWWQTAREPWDLEQFTFACDLLFGPKRLRLNAVLLVRFVAGEGAGVALAGLLQAGRTDFCAH